MKGRKNSRVLGSLEGASGGLLKDIPPGEPFIVKVQVSLAGEPGTSICSEDNNLFLLIPDRSIGEKLLKKKVKGFFWACMKEDGSLNIGQKTFEQEW